MSCQTTEILQIRLFGDPAVRHSEIPEILIDVSVGIESSRISDELQESHHVVPDFVAGWAFGRAIGIGVRGNGGWWTFRKVSLHGEYKVCARGCRNRRLTDFLQGLNLELMHETRLAPTQTRILPVVLTQTEEFHGSHLFIDLTAVVSASSQIVITITLPIKQFTLWETHHFDFITATYFYATSIPTAFVAIPPKLPNDGAALPPLLDLRKFHRSLKLLSRFRR